MGLWICSFFDISSADMNSLKCVFQCVHTRVSLTYMFRNEVAMLREKAQGSIILFLKVFVPIYTHTSSVQELLHPLHISTTCYYPIC